MSTNSTVVTMILSNHRKWLRTGGKEGEKANFSGVDLSNASIRNIDLSGVTFIGANLTGAVISRADLTQAVFERAALEYTRFTNVKLGGAEFTNSNCEASVFARCDLEGSMFESALMQEVQFLDCNCIRMTMKTVLLKGARFSGKSSTRPLKMHRLALRESSVQQASFVNVDMRDVDVCICDFLGSQFSRARISGDCTNNNFTAASFVNSDLSDAVFSGSGFSEALFDKARTENTQFPHYNICPSGQFTAYKKVSMRGEAYVIELLIPRSARRTSSLVGRKCRTDKAKVVAYFDRNGNRCASGKDTFYSYHGHTFSYELGAWVKEPSYDPNPLVECTQGIHFFMTYEEARDY